MNKRISLFIFFSLFFLRLPAQKLNPYQDKYVRDVIAHQFYECANGVNFESGMANFFVIKRDTFFNPIGYHYLFQLKGDSIERIDYSIFHGGNFNRFSFTDSQNIYLLGGYGMFVTHNNLEAFDLKSKEWYIKATTGPKPPFVCGFTFKSGNYVYTFNNIKGGNNTEPDEFNKDIYRLDLKTFSWEKFENLNTNLEFVFNTVINRVEVFYTKDYLLNITGNKFILINPSNLNYLILDNNGLKHKDYSYKIDHNRLYFKNKSSSEIIENEQIFDIDSIYQSNKSLAIPLILEPTWFQYVYFTYNRFIWGGLFLIIIATIIVLIFKKVVQIIKAKKLKAVPEIQAITRSHPLIQIILNSPKTEITLHELDTLLGIDHMEHESKKMKRHRLLIALFEIHPNLLTRIKDPMDKRKTIFKITKN